MPLTQVNGGMLDSVAQQVGFRNRIINGDMRIDQRNAGASVTNSASGSVLYTLDRWGYAAPSGSKFTIQQNAGSVTPPAGFVNYLGVTSSAATTIVSGDYYTLSHKIEGLNVSDFSWGTANAQPVTLSFWVRSSLTGSTFPVVLRNSASNRSYGQFYTISSANTWEYKTITIPGDTSGTWLTNNGVGLELLLALGTGSAYNISTTGAWGATGSIIGITGQTNILATNGATFYITGVQLEKGSTATSFDYRPYGTELALCQRYCQVWGGTSSYERLGNAYNHSTTQARMDMPLGVQMRATPSLSYTSAGNFGVEVAGGGFYTITSMSLDQATNRVASVNANVSSGLTSGQGCHVTFNNSTTERFILSAEL